MIPLFVMLAACKPSGQTKTDPGDPPTDVSPLDTLETATDTGTGASPPGPRPLLASPAEALDLDPDPGVVRVELIAAERPEGYAYNGQVPGPTLRAKIGDTLIVDLTNALPDPTTIHWHGVSVPYDMDGVTWQNDPIAPGDSFRYSFTLATAGTFWYHPHFDTERQVDLGLYGVLVVEDPADPVADEELIVVLDAIDEIGLAESDPHEVDVTAAQITLNGAIDPVYVPSAGASVRVRMVNASGSQVLLLEDVRQIASDQGLLPSAVQGDLRIAPGDRVDLEWSVGSPFEVQRLPYTVAGGVALGDPIRLLSVQPTASQAEPDPLAWPFVSEAPTPDPGTSPTYGCCSPEAQERAGRSTARPSPR